MRGSARFEHESERDLSQSCFDSPSAAANPPRIPENSGGGCTNTPAVGEEHRVVVGRIADWGQMRASIET